MERLEVHATRSRVGPRLAFSLWPFPLFPPGFRRTLAAIGILISLQPATGPMETEAASAGFYEHKMNKQKFPRLQLRTVKELMEGKGIERPSTVAATDETFKKAPESKKKHGEQKALEL
jgi:site-specific DNA-methyltransferase (adenine-specific)